MTISPTTLTTRAMSKREKDCQLVASPSRAETSWLPLGEPSPDDAVECGPGGVPMEVYEEEEEGDGDDDAMVAG